MHGFDVATFACRDGQAFGGGKIVDRNQRCGDGFACGPRTDVADPRAAGTDRFQYIVDAVGYRAAPRHEERSAACFEHARRAADRAVQHHSTRVSDKRSMDALVGRRQRGGLDDDLTRFERGQNTVGAVERVAHGGIFGQAGKDDVSGGHDLGRGGGGDASGGD